MKFLVEYVQVLGFVTAPKFFKQDGGVILSDGRSLSALKHGRSTVALATSFTLQKGK